MNSKNKKLTDAIARNLNVAPMVNSSPSTQRQRQPIILRPHNILRSHWISYVLMSITPGKPVTLTLK